MTSLLVDRNCGAQLEWRIGHMMWKDIRGCPRLVVLLPPPAGRRAIFLFSFGIFAFEGSGRGVAVSSTSGTLDGTLF